MKTRMLTSDYWDCDIILKTEAVRTEIEQYIDNK